MADLTFEEQRIIGECLRAAADGPFFPEWEFQTLFGVERRDVAKVASDWPFADASSQTLSLSVNNSMLHLMYYPHRKWDAWEEFISVSPAEVERIFQKWRGIRLHGSAARRAFDGLA